MNFLSRWKEKRVRDRLAAENRRRAKIIQRDKVKQRTEEKYQQNIREEAYLLWEADGKPEGKDEYYLLKAKQRIDLKNIPAIYKPYYFVEKRFLEPSDAWISKQAFFTILGRLGNLAFIVAVVSFIFGENIRRNNEVFAAWQTINSAHGQRGSGGRIEAMEFLNSRPWRFPWIVFTETWTLQTEKDWYLSSYWDEKEQKRKHKCKQKRLFGRRWKRQSLQGLSLQNVPTGEGEHYYEVYLAGIDLCSANLSRADLNNANLSGAFLSGANLSGSYLNGTNLSDANLNEANLMGAYLTQLNNDYLRGANLRGANLRGAYLRSNEELDYTVFKSACFWDEAIFISKWNEETQAEEAIPGNKYFIEELKQHKPSNPDIPPNCSIWQSKN